MEALSQEMTLRDYAGVVLRRKLVVLGAIVVALVVAVVSSTLQTPIYSASADVLVQPRSQDGLSGDQVVNLNDRAIQTEIQVIEGQAVRQRVQDDLGLDELPARVDASSVGETDVVAFTVRSTNAANARTLANAYADAYISVRLEQSVGELLAASTQIQERINELENQLADLPEDDPTRNGLVAQLSNFNLTLDQLRVDQNLRTGGAVVIKSAEVPATPVEPTPLRTAVLALVVGLLIGLGAAFLLDYLDDKVRTEDDLEKLTPRPVIAHVPTHPPPDERPISITEPTHASAEAYRGLRTNVQFLGLDDRLSVVQVTSSLPGEGKTTTATNLAVVLAQAGHQVALVDADLRRPRINQVFSLDVAPGLTDMLLGMGPKDALQRVGIGNGHSLAVYASGNVPSNPSEMLSGRRMKSLLDKMGEHYDYVIVDSAPVLPVSDSVALAGAVDGVILVAQAGRVTTGEVAEALERLERVSAPVIGLALNQAASGERDVYAYGGYAPAAGTWPAPHRVDDGTQADDIVFSDA